MKATYVPDSKLTKDTPYLILTSKSMWDLACLFWVLGEKGLRDMAVSLNT